MRWIVGTLIILPLALNAPSTAAANACVRLGWVPGGAQGLAAIRPGERLPLCGGAASGGAGLRPVTLVGAGWHGTLHSHETRVDGLVGVHALSSQSVEGGGHADLRKLRARLDTTRKNALRLRVVLATILITFVVFAPRLAVMGGAAAIAAALVLSAFGSTSLTLFALLTLLGALLPWRALWLFFGAYLIVLVASPETQSLALLGPHPWGGGRFFGISNEVETLLLAPALVLGLAAAPLVLLTVGWSRAGADGGGLLALLAAYARFVPRPRAAAAAVVALAVLFVAVDAATGGSSHVTHSVLHGNVFHDLWHRWGVSWHGATGAWGRGVVSAICLVALAWVATRTPRARVVDAFLLGIVVSLVANDTPQDVLFWGAITGVGLRRAV
ncbi:MAG: hypothetical protein HOQ28_18535 [Thermoleophilia bacterium]|nr:hypothetical protein [Thermoleophilia bacterium]